MLRLFLAIDLPDPIRQEVAAMCTQVSNARWVKPHQLHITLRFMGKTPDDDLAGIRERLARVEPPGFELALRGAGVFPGGDKRARVLWLGLDPTEPLVHLSREIDACLGSDTQREKQEFSPHLTLARFTEKPDATLTQFLLRHRTYSGTRWPVACFKLYQSTLLSNGAVHSLVSTYALAEFCREQ
ncbi:MAG TPA: RNA 2',3'-cyclic phosphodiesterase [Polyangia bacterium]